MATAVIKDHASQKRRNFISKFLIYFFLIVITACMLLPFLWMLSSSFKLNKDVFGFPIQWIPKNPRWQNYVDIWTQIPLLTFVKNTVKITVVVTLLQLFTSSFAAYAFAKMQFTAADSQVIASGSGSLGSSSEFWVYAGSTGVSGNVNSGTVTPQP